MICCLFDATLLCFVSLWDKVGWFSFCTIHITMLHVCSILVMVLVISNSESTDEKDSYDHVVWLGNEKAVKLSWSACSQDRTVRFEVESRINGWIGLGLLNDGDTGILTKKDIWIGWINEKGIAKLKVMS